MIRFVFSLSVLKLVHCSCPSGFELVSEGECRGKYGNFTAYFDEAYEEGTDLCAQIQGTLPIIHNQEQQDYWTYRDPSIMKAIGLVCNTSTMLWEWTDGSQVDYKPPSYHELLDDNCTSYEFGDFGKVWFMTYYGDWTWGQGHFSPQVSFDLWCITQLHQPIPSEDGCERFNDDEDDGVCYQIGTVAESWRDAQLICEKLGANLASIHNVNENSFIRRLAVSKGATNGVFIGVTVFGKDKLGWMDSSDWDYNNFAPGFPNPDFGECVILDTSTSSGMWRNVACDAKLPVACIREKSTESNATCSTQTWEEEKIITSPGFPYSASLPCEYNLTVAEGKRVEIEIKFLEANTCCDALLLYEGDKLLANLTGEVHLDDMEFWYSRGSAMRVIWQPKGAVNVRGAAFTFRGV